VARNPSTPSKWYGVEITNNIFANNVAGWDGGGVSLHDAVKVDFINNTVVSNDSTATAGVLFDTTVAPGANQPPNGCDPVLNPNCVGFQVTTSNFLPAGLSTESHTANFLGAFTGPVVCPTGHPQCTKFSNPVLSNNLFFQNRSFRITAPTPPAVGPVQLVPNLSQGTTGSCPAGTGSAGTTAPFYWDIGVYNDSSPTNHGSGLTLNPQYSMLTSTTGYAGTNIAPASAGVVGQYCNGSRVPPEIASQLCAGPNGQANAQGCIQPGTVGLGITVPSGVPDSTPPPLAQFTLTPAATVDEGSNWINMFYGPLSLVNPTILSGAAGYSAPIGNYALTAGSAAIDAIPANVSHPATDFFGNSRPDHNSDAHFDIGAVEYQAPAAPAAANVTSGPLTFSSPVGVTSAAQTLTLHNTGGAGVVGITVVVTVPFARPAGAAGGTCSTTLAAGATCTINVVFTPTATGAASGTATITASVAVTGSPVALSGTGTAVGTLSFTSATNGTLGTVLGARALTFTIPTPRAAVTSVITVTNTGGGPLAITAETLAINMGGLYSITAQNCTTLSPLAPNGTCTVSVRYATPAARPFLPDLGLLDVANNGSGTLGG